MAAKEREKRRQAHRRSSIRQTRRDKQSARKRLRRYIFGGITGIAGIMIVLSLVLPTSLGSNNSNANVSYAQGSRIDIQEPINIPNGETHPEYNSSPPTSGWYYTVERDTMKWGLNEHPFKEEEQVSFLKDGAILIQYNCPENCDELVKQLNVVASRYPRGVKVAPYNNITNRVSLTSWGWIDTFDDFDELRIEDFIQMHIDNGPMSFKNY